MNDTGTNILGGILGLLMIGAMVAVGIAADSFWVGALVFLSLVITLIAIGLTGSDQHVGAVLVYILSIAVLFWATWLGHGAGKWWWLVPWLYTAIIGLGIGITAGEGSAVGTAAVSYILAALTAIMAFLIPTALYPMLSRVAETPSIAPVEAGGGFNWLIVLTIALLAGAATSLGFAYYHGTEWNPGRFILFSVLGIALLLGAFWSTGFVGGWWWTIAWILAGGLILFGALDIRDWASGTGIVGILIAVLCAAMAFASPLWIGPALERGVQVAQVEKGEPTLAPEPTRKMAPTEAPEPTKVPTKAPAPTQVIEAEATPGVPGFFSALGTFLWSGIKSIWGIVHLLIFFFIGQVWLRRWGGLIVLLVLLAAVAFFGGRDQATLNSLTHFISSSPATWMFDLVRWSEVNFGSMGWGILGLAAAMPPILYPVYRLSYKATRDFGQASKFKELFGSTFAQRYLESQRLEYGRMLMSWLVLYVIVFGIPLCLWIALRWIPDQAPGMSVNFLFIPDLTVPSFKPVWHYAYFALAGLNFLLTFIISRMHKTSSVTAAMPIYGNLWMMLISLVLLALLVPAGVVEFTFGQSITLIGVLAIILNLMRKEDRIAREKAEEEERKRKEEEARRKLEEQRKALAAEQARLEAERKRLEQERLAAKDEADRKVRLETEKKAKEEAERKKRQADLLAEAKKLTESNPEGAAALLEQLRSENPSYPGLADALKKVGQVQSKVDLLFKEAKRALEDELPAKAKELLDQVADLSPRYPGLAALQKEVAKLLQLKGSALFKHVSPITDVIYQAITQADLAQMTIAEGVAIPTHDEFYILDQRGKIYWIKEGGMHSPVDLKITKPLALLTLTQDRLLAVSTKGELVQVEGQDSLTIFSSANVGIGIAACRLNPFRTMLAYVTTGFDQVRGFFLATSNAIDFFNQTGLASALAFSDKGQYLAVGDQQGDLHILSLAHRTKVGQAGLSSLRSPVLFLEALPEDRWLSAYNDRLITWQADGQPAGQTRLTNPPTCIALLSNRNLFAIGTAEGTVRVYNLKDMELIKDARVHDGRVTHILFQPDGSRIVCVGENIVFRSLEV